mmetsp:Transcript_6148/g.23213  ORF Transcript_6148/g.23213 Transcript_6148/m.23213 type:complete len:175 (+) Transcript_6148:334-858(+)
MLSRERVMLASSIYCIEDAEGNCSCLMLDEGGGPAVGRPQQKDCISATAAGHAQEYLKNQLSCGIRARENCHLPGIIELQSSLHSVFYPCHATSVEKSCWSDADDENRYHSSPLGPPVEILHIAQVIYLYSAYDAEQRMAFHTPAEYHSRVLKKMRNPASRFRCLGHRVNRVLC